MAHGSTTTVTDSFTGSNTGQTITLPVGPNPEDYSIRAHVISVCTIVGTVTGAVLSFDVQLKDGTWQDSGTTFAINCGLDRNSIPLQRHF